MIFRLEGFLTIKDTLRKTNMEPENGPLEKEKHLQTTNFRVAC